MLCLVSGVCDMLVFFITQREGKKKEMDYGIFKCNTLYLGNLMLDYSVLRFFGVCFFNIV